MDRCPDQSPEEPKPKLTVGDIFRAGAAAYRRKYGYTLTVEQDRALREIPGCRKALVVGDGQVGRHAARVLPAEEEDGE